MGMNNFDVADIHYVPTTGVSRVHETPLVVPHADHAELLDRQGRVHARVSVDFAKESGCYLGVPMREP